MKVPHDGGPCPVKIGEQVRVHYRGKGTQVLAVVRSDLHMWAWKDRGALLANDVVAYEYVRVGADPVLEKVAELRRRPVRHVDLGDVLDLVEELARRTPVA